MSNLILLLFYFASTKSLIFSYFYILALVRGLRSYFNCIWSLIDTLTMKVIADKTNYGKHRLYGSLAWGLNGVIAGKLIDLYGMNVMFSMSCFWGLITFGLILFCMPRNIKSRRLSHLSDLNSEHHSMEDIGLLSIDEEAGEIVYLQTDNDHGEYEKATTDENANFQQILKSLVSLRKNHEFVMSLVIMLVYWNAMFIVRRILFIQMQQELGATKFMNGIATFCMWSICHLDLLRKHLTKMFCKNFAFIWGMWTMALFSCSPLLRFNIARNPVLLLFIQFDAQILTEFSVPVLSYRLVCAIAGLLIMHWYFNDLVDLCGWDVAWNQLWISIRSLQSLSVSNGRILQCAEWGWNQYPSNSTVVEGKYQCPVHPQWEYYVAANLWSIQFSDSLCFRISQSHSKYLYFVVFAVIGHEIDECSFWNWITLIGWHMIAFQGSLFIACAHEIVVWSNSIKYCGPEMW